MEYDLKKKNKCNLRFHNAADLRHPFGKNTFLLWFHRTRGYFSILDVFLLKLKYMCLYNSQNSRLNSNNVNLKYEKKKVTL